MILFTIADISCPSASLRFVNVLNALSAVILIRLIPSSRRLIAISTKSMIFSDAFSDFSAALSEEEDLVDELEE